MTAGAFADGSVRRKVADIALEIAGSYVADEYPDQVPSRFFSAVVASVEQELGAALFDIDLPGLHEFGRGATA